jgi:hypothetical protein
VCKRRINGIYIKKLRLEGSYGAAIRTIITQGDFEVLPSASTFTLILGKAEDQNLENHLDECLTISASHADGEKVDVDAPSHSYAIEISTERMPSEESSGNFCGRSASI